MQKKFEKMRTPAKDITQFKIKWNVASKKVDESVVKHLMAGVSRKVHHCNHTTKLIFFLLFFFSHLIPKCNTKIFINKYYSVFSKIN